METRALFRFTFLIFLFCLYSISARLGN
jgi:hypothetical protein